MVAKPRVVRRDGIHFEGLSYLDPTLAAYVGKPVITRYDPRDVTQIRAFYRDRFLCCAINADHLDDDETISLKDIQGARKPHRRALRQQLTTRRAAVTEYLPSTAPEATPPRPVQTRRGRQPAAAVTTARFRVARLLHRP